METLERVIPQAMPKIDIGSSGDLFYKCPVGGFASLLPGVCPKCDERLVAVSVLNETEDVQITVGDGKPDGRSSKR